MKDIRLLLPEKDDYNTITEITFSEKGMIINIESSLSYKEGYTHLSIEQIIELFNFLKEDIEKYPDFYND